MKNKDHPKKANKESVDQILKQIKIIDETKNPDLAKKLNDGLTEEFKRELLDEIQSGIVENEISGQMSSISTLNKQNGQITNNSNKLKNKAIKEVAQWIGVNEKHLAITLYGKPRIDHYNQKRFPKSNGKERIIHAVQEPLKSIQRKLLEKLENKYQPSPFCHGFVKDKSIISNAKMHTRKKVIIKIDLKDFFPSITFPRVRGMFSGPQFNLPTSWATIIAQISCLDINYGGLPQGGVISPYISNLITRKLDARLHGLANEFKMHFTRYADDMTFSTNANIDISIFLGRAYKIIEEERFTVNEEKTRIMYPWNRQAVTGVIVNDGLNVNRKYIRNIRAILHNCEEKGLYSQIVKSRLFKDDRNSRVSLTRKDKKFYTHNGTEVDVATAKRMFLKNLEGQIQFVGQVVNANDLDNNAHYNNRFKIYEELLARLNRITVADKIGAVVNSVYKESIQRRKEIDGREITLDVCTEIINEKIINDARYFFKSFNFEDEIKLNEQITKLEETSIDKYTVQKILADFRNSADTFLGRLVHSSKITKKEFNEFLKSFNSSMRLKIPLEFGKRLNSILEKLYGFTTGFKWEKSFSLWEIDEARTKHIFDLKKMIRFEEAKPDECKNLKTELNAVIDRVKKENKFKKKVSVKTTIKIKNLYTYTDGILEGIKQILTSMIKHTNSNEIHISAKRSDDNNFVEIKIFDMDSNRELDFEPIRDNLANGKIKAAMENLYGFCDYFIIAQYKEEGWQKVNMFIGNDISTTEPELGFTHFLRFKRI